jgi:poly(3-hydroxybutyrate) depolymerase
MLHEPARGGRLNCGRRRGASTRSRFAVSALAHSMARAAQCVHFVYAALIAVACAPGHVELTRREPASSRNYRIVMQHDHVAQTPTAALFMLHAYATPPDLMLRRYRLIERVVGERNWLLVIPQGEPDDVGKLAWNASAACCGEGEAVRSRDDVGYLRGVLTDLRAHFAIDPKRVFAFGVSNGSFMALRWACTPNAGLRAVVSIAGAAPGPDDPPCAASSPMSLLHMHGTADEVILYSGSHAAGSRYPGARDSVALWRTLAGTAARADERWRRSLFLDRVHEERWKSEHARVELWTFEDAGHVIRALPFEIESLLAFLDRPTH